MEQNILLWIQNNLRNDFLNPIMIFITSLGNGGAIWIAISITLLFFRKTRKIGVMVMCALIFSSLICDVLLKNIIARVRPFNVTEGLVCLIKKPSSYSFPSGHTQSSFVAALVLFLCLPKKYSFSALILAVLIGFSRLYVGVHYPTDVLCGALFGSAIAISVYLGERKISLKKQTQN